MEKLYGNYERMDCLMQTGRRRWLLYYGLFEDENGQFIYQQQFERKPTLAEIKALVIEAINDKTQEKIVSGFKWNDMLVWLSEANQLNYARDFNLVTKNDQVELPTYKFGTDDAPVYYTFETFEELETFNAAWAKHISDAVREGWHEKANVDWEAFTL